MNNFAGKKALIIGASGGMGSAVATMLAKNGVHCALVGRDKQKLEDVFSVCSSSGNDLVVMAGALPACLMSAALPALPGWMRCGIAFRLGPLCISGARGRGVITPPPAARQGLSDARVVCQLGLHIFHKVFSVALFHVPGGDRGLLGECHHPLFVRSRRFRQ